MADDSHFENQNIAISPELLANFDEILHEDAHISPLDLYGNSKIDFF